MLSTYDPDDYDTWPKLPPHEAARDLFLHWLTSDYTNHGTTQRATTTATAYAGFATSLLRVLTNEGTAAWRRALEAAQVRHETAKGGHPPSYQKVCAWREYVAFVNCHVGPEGIGWLMPCRSPEHQTALGEMIERTPLGYAIRILLRHFPPHTLSSLKLTTALDLIAGHLSPPLWSDDARRALAYCIRWGYEAGVFKHGPDFNYAAYSTAIPEVPAGRTGMRPVIIADVGTYRWDAMSPSLNTVLAEDFLTLRDRIFYVPHDMPKALVARRRIEAVQEDPQGFNIESFLTSRREGLRKVRAKSLPVIEVRTEHEPLMPMAAAEGEERPITKKEWSLHVSVANTHALGESESSPVLPQPASKPSPPGAGLFDPPDAPWLR